ncbi:hypothetical protein [Pelosinus sp. sgz500959]|uniref:hypothetical protein n=1 Tax=Pelosinus sp. sgz500959 TaxID=3242472 RepID=UPI003670FB0B
MISLTRLSSPLSAQDWLGMLIMQPLVHDKLYKNIGFQWRPEFKTKQLADLGKLMDLAQDPVQAGHNTKTNIILVPEYGIPGLEGFNLLYDRMKDSTVSYQILIGGMDGLSKKDFLELLGKSDLTDITKAHMADSANRAEWVNTAVILEKVNENVNFYVQPKHLPAGPEDNTMMCEGDQFIVFATTPTDIYRAPICFFIPICFDWIGRQGSISQINSLASEMIELTRKEYLVNAFWIIPVIQHNPKPDNIDFLQEARERLTGGLWCNVYDSRACIVMANTASPINSSDYGQSSFIYRDGPYGLSTLPRPTVISKERHGLQGCGEQRFRENNPVIHTVYFVPPTATAGRSGDPRIPFKEAKLICLDADLSVCCPKRWPVVATAVDPYVKTFGDLLDTSEIYLRRFSQQTSIAEGLSQYIEQTIMQSRNFTNSVIYEKMLLLCRWESFKAKECDSWKSDVEGISTSNLIRNQALLSLAFDDFNINGKYHGNFNINDIHNILIVADGHQQKSHCELEEEIRTSIDEGEICISRCDQVVVIGHTTPEWVYRGSLMGEPEIGQFTDQPRIRYIPSSKIISILGDIDNTEQLNQFLGKELGVM